VQLTELRDFSVGFEEGNFHVRRGIVRRLWSKELQDGKVLSSTILPI
jgi:hypothetical protein